MVLDPRGLVRSRDKLKTYLNYHYRYVHQTLQDGDFPCGASTWEGGTKVLRDHMTN